MMKIAVYSICKNEEKHIERYLHSARKADGIFVLDTGSDDDSVLLLEKGRAEVKTLKIQPWRFDQARNYAMSMIPSDFDLCVSLDIDELLEEDWYEKLEDVFSKNSWANLIENYYRQDGGLDFRNRKIHTRAGWRWIYPVHEELYRNDIRSIFVDVRMLHKPDKKKPRNYLPLIELTLEEFPGNVRFQHYRSLELISSNRKEEAIEQLREMLFKNEVGWRYSWNIERSYNFLILSSLLEEKEKLQVIYTAVANAPDWRDAWYALAVELENQKMYYEAHQTFLKALSIEERIKVSYSNRNCYNQNIYLKAASSAERINLDKTDEIYRTGIRVMKNDNLPYEELIRSYSEFLSRRS